MNYVLSIYSETHPVEDLRLPPSAVLQDDPEGKPFSFISPIRLPLGKTCRLVGDTVEYQLVVNGCFGFAYSRKFFVSGTIASRQSTAVPSAA